MIEVTFGNYKYQLLGQQPNWWKRLTPLNIFFNGHHIDPLSPHSSNCPNWSVFATLAPAGKTKAATSKNFSGSNNNSDNRGNFSVSTRRARTKGAHYKVQGMRRGWPVKTLRRYANARSSVNRFLAIGSRLALKRSIDWLRRFPEIRRISVEASPTQAFKSQSQTFRLFIVVHWPRSSTRARKRSLRRAPVKRQGTSQPSGENRGEFRKTGKFYSRWSTISFYWRISNSSDYWGSELMDRKVTNEFSSFSNMTTESLFVALCCITPWPNVLLSCAGLAFTNNVLGTNPDLVVL